MLTILSPAKALDFDTPLATRKRSEPRFLPEAERLARKMKRLSPAELSSLAGISRDLALLNHGRWKDWSADHGPDNARPAVFAFKGDVYLGLDAWRFSGRDLDFAQKRLRILSGLYGALRPLDLIRPYRLEMGTRLAAGRARNLHGFWGERVTDSLNEDLAGRPKRSRILVNLASREYFGAVRTERLDARVVTPVFKDRTKAGAFKVLMFHAKRARGAMAAWIVRHRVADPDRLRDFDEDGYRFREDESTGDELVFRRAKA